MPQQILKRDGSLQKWDPSRIETAVNKALIACNIDHSEAKAKSITGIVLTHINGAEQIHQEFVQDVVEKVLMQSGYSDAAKEYILYRERRREIRDQKNAYLDIAGCINSYIDRDDWRVNENANMDYSFQGLTLNISGEVQAKYVLNKYSEDIREAHQNGYIHIHDLSFGLAGYCAGWSLYDVILEGFNLPGACSSGPAKHFDTILSQAINFIGTLQNEWAGAQAFNNFDTLIAPFIRYDVEKLEKKYGMKLSDEYIYGEIVKQGIQRFLFNMNTTSRWGGQCVSHDTECLTPTGWKTYDQLQVGDEIFVFDTETNQIRPDIIERVLSYEYEGDVFHFEGRKLDFITTPDHRCVRKLHNDNGFIIETANEISQYKTAPKIPTAAEVDRPDWDYLHDDHIRLLGWVLADGTMEKNRDRVAIYQSEKKFADYIQELLDRLEITYTRKIKVGEWNKECVEFRFSGDYAKWLCSFCNRDKRIPELFKQYASARQIRIFLEEFARGDGELVDPVDPLSTRVRIGQKRKDMRDDLQFLALLAGIGTSINKSGNCIPKVVLQSRNIASATKITKEQYSGIVWCPTTKTGTFIARRNDKTFITGNCPFSNLTMDLTPPKHLAKQAVIIGGVPQDATYADFQKEMDMINKAFLEVLLNGDINGNIFSFPIPTYNVTEDFPWDSEIGDLLLKMTAQYGAPYFQNFISSDMDPEDVRSMCCRLQMDKRQLKEHLKKTGGLFGAGDLTGSIGVVTLNLPKMAYLSKNKEEFFEKIKQYATIAKRSLEFKRKLLENNLDKGMYPWSKRYLKNRFTAHFSTIGVVGGNEACLNLIGTGIDSNEGLNLMIDTLNYLRELVISFQEETENLYNLEATPAEGTSYKLARKDKQVHPDIITSGDEEPYYTNSTQLPVDATRDPFEALEHQNQLQPLYTGGTVFHTYIGEAVADPHSIKEFLLKAFKLTKLPYISITPTFSVCPDHSYIPGEHFTCPKCGKDTEVYTRIVGYYRPVNRWNKGKRSEYCERRVFRGLE